MIIIVNCRIRSDLPFWKLFLWTHDKKELWLTCTYIGLGAYVRIKSLNFSKCFKNTSQNHKIIWISFQHKTINLLTSYRNLLTVTVCIGYLLRDEHFIVLLNHHSTCDTYLLSCAMSLIWWPHYQFGWTFLKFLFVLTTRDILSMYYIYYKTNINLDDIIDAKTGVGSPLAQEVADAITASRQLLWLFSVYNEKNTGP